MKNNRGFTLVELIVVLAILSIILVITTSMTFMMFDRYRHTVENREQNEAASRILDSIRSDIRAYGVPEKTFDNDELLLWDKEGKRITYTVLEKDMPGWKVIARNSVTGNGPNVSERFRLPDNIDFDFRTGNGEFENFFAVSLFMQIPEGPEQDLKEFDPFTRTVPEGTEPDPKYAGNWRTIIVRTGEKKVQK